MRTCKCGNTNQDDFSPYRGNTCRLCENKKAAEYRAKHPDRRKAANATYQQKIKSKTEPPKPQPLNLPPEPQPDSAKLFNTLLAAAKSSGRYTVAQLAKTRTG